MTEGVYSHEYNHSIRYLLCTIFLLSMSRYLCNSNLLTNINMSRDNVSKILFTQQSFQSVSHKTYSLLLLISLNPPISWAGCSCIIIETMFRVFSQYHTRYTPGLFLLLIHISTSFNADLTTVGKSVILKVICIFYLYADALFSFHDTYFHFNVSMVLMQFQSFDLSIYKSLFNITTFDPFLTLTHSLLLVTPS